MLDFIKGQSKTTLILGAIGALATVATVGYGLHSFAFPKNSEELLPAVTEEQADEIMNIIMEKIKKLIPKLISGADGIKQQLAQQGQQMEDRQLMKMFILPHVDTAFADIQREALEKFDFDDDELQEAVDYYIKEGNKSLEEISTRIKMVYREFGGETTEDAVPKKSANAQKISIDEVIALMEDLGDKMKTYANLYCKKFVDEHGIPRSQQELQLFQMGLMETAESAEKALLDSNGLTATDFQAILVENQNHPELGAIFQQMQVDNQKILKKHGIAMQ